MSDDVRWARRKIDGPFVEGAVSGETSPASKRRRAAGTAAAAGLSVLVLALTVIAIADPGLFTGRPTPASIEPSPVATQVVVGASGAASPSAGSSVPIETPATPSVGPLASATPFPPLAAGVVPILYLHRVEAPPAGWPSWTAARQKAFLSYDVIPAAFAADLDWLKANGYTTILPRDLAAHWDHGTKLPPRPVIVTLDDGSPSWTKTVLPILQARGMVAEFYVTIDAIERGSISWREVRELADAGMGIGAHDVHHVQLAGLGPSASPASVDEMWFEVNQARIVIGEHLGVKPDSMAYVGGGFDAQLVDLVRKAGYTTARSIIRGIDQPESARFALRVVAIAPHDDVVDPYTGELVAGLPTFTAKMAGDRT